MIIERLKYFYRYLEQVTGYSAIRIKNTNNAVIIMYHGVDDSFTSQQFESHIKYFTKHFKVVKFEDIIRFAEAKYSSNELLLSITFDDGLKNNITNVYPILLKYNVPATFYVCPFLIEEKQWLWNHELRCKLPLIDENKRSKLFLDFEINYTNIDKVLDTLKFRVKTSFRKHFLDTVRELTKDYTPNDIDILRYGMMTWDDIFSMDKNIVEIGSHSFDHSILTNMDTSEIEYQVLQSKIMLEKKLDREIKHFCYPNGTYTHAEKEIVSRYYQSAVSTAVGSIAVGDDLMELKRVHSTEELSYMAWLIKKNVVLQGLFDR